MNTSTPAKTKVRTVTVPVEFVRMAVIMRQRQRKYFAERSPSLIEPAKQAEAEFDKLLAQISKDLQAAQTLVEEAIQEPLL